MEAQMVLEIPIDSMSGPGADGVWFTDDDVQSDYGANDIIYCGYRYDVESQLYYVRNRTYNPALGRWIQRDPIGYQGGVNLYEYVGGRPERSTDPKGQAVAAAAKAPHHQPNWRVYLHTCTRATGGYGTACASQSRGCNGPVKPWPCCAAAVSLFICAYLWGRSYGVPSPGPILLVNGIPFPSDPCFLGCINWCLYQHFASQKSPDWKGTRAACKHCGNCSKECCRDSVRSEQTQLTDCSLGCEAHCGTPHGEVAKLMQMQAQRIKLGIGLCCGR